MPLKLLVRQEAHYGELELLTFNLIVRTIEDLVQQVEQDVEVEDSCLDFLVAHNSHEDEVGRDLSLHADSAHVSVLEDPYDAIHDSFEN